MPQERLSMRKIREVLRLRWEQGLSHRQIVASCRLGQGTVAEYLRRASAAGLTWPLTPVSPLPNVIAPFAVAEPPVQSGLFTT